MKYLLNKKSLNERNKFKVTIVAESNYADYITVISTYSKEIFDEYIIGELIELNKHKGWKKLKYFNYKELDMPHDDDGEICPTLESLTVEYIDESGENWDVELKGGN